jgi:hypothetical protein
MTGIEVLRQSDWTEATAEGTIARDAAQIDGEARQRRSCRSHSKWLSRSEVAAAASTD